MRRKKVQVAYIANDTARKATYKKRKKGLLKKASELSTLCGVEACAIVRSPYEREPVVWPDPERARKVVEDFLDMPEMDRQRKMFDHPAYLWDRISKSNQQLARLIRENRQKSVALAMYGCLAGEKSLEDFSDLDLNDLSWMIDRNLEEIGRKLEALGLQESADPAAPQQPMPNVGLSMPGQLAAAESSVLGQGPSMWQFYPAAEAGSSSSSSGAVSSIVQPGSGGEPN